MAEMNARSRMSRQTALDVDVVVVAYDSAATLRACVAALDGYPGVRLHIVDNASRDDSAAEVADLDLDLVRLAENRGFGGGCNVGWRRGSALYVLFLNPDAELDISSLARIAAVLEEEPRVGAVAPMLRGADGALEYSQRRFPRIRSALGRAFFVHRLGALGTWADEVIRDDAAYLLPRSVEWVSGACLMVRRDLLEALDGFDERFFMYSEDVDLCKRIRDAGYDVRYEPSAIGGHHGGVSAPRAEMRPLLAASRVLYARKHHGRMYAALETAGLVAESLIRIPLSRDRVTCRGHLRVIPAIIRAWRAADRQST